MSELAIEEKRAEVVEADSTSVVLSRVWEIARDPEADPAKMQALLDIVTQLEEKESRKDFDAALARVQKACPVVPKNGTIDMGAKGTMRYAKFEDIQDAVNPLLREEGFSTTYDEEPVDGAPLKRVTVTLRRRGQTHSASFLAPLVDEGPGRNKAQAMVSANSYARRRALVMALDIMVEGEDDDGNGGSEPITENQIMDLDSLITEIGANRTRFLEFMCVDSLGEILGRDYERAVNALETKRRNG